MCVFVCLRFQVCIQQTALDLLSRGYDVHILVDGSSSRSQVDRMFALEVSSGCTRTLSLFSDQPIREGRPAISVNWAGDTQAHGSAMMATKPLRTSLPPSLPLSQSLYVLSLFFSV